MMEDREHSTWAELLPLLAMRALEGEERAAVERHAASCPACRRELMELERDLGTLAEAPGVVEPPPEIRIRLLEVIAAEGTATVDARGPARWWLAAAAALILVTGGLWLQALQGTRDLRLERDRLAAELARAETEVDALRRQQTALVREIETLRDPGSRHVLLAGLEPTSRASGRTVVDPEGDRARFYAFGLPQLADDEDYELWLIAEGTPVAAGIFDVDARGEAVLDIESLPSLDRIDAWAVTIEPAGGVPQPTGAMVLKS
jgi:anti-sigma-K factor RskA